MADVTTESKNPGADDEVPPVARVFGRAVSEWITYTFIVLCIIAVIFGSKVGGERDLQAERAMATLGLLSEAAENQFAADGALICDETLLKSEQLENDYLTLTIGQAPFNEDDKSLGYGPALYVSVVEKEVSGDTWDTAKRLMELVKEAGEKEAELHEALTDRVEATSQEAMVDQVTKSEESKKPKNRLREIRKRSYGEDEEFLRYYILASETAVCS